MVSLPSLLISGYSNGVTVHNGMDHNPSKLKQLEVQRLELGSYYFEFLVFGLCVVTND